MKRFLKLSLIGFSTFSFAGTIVGYDNNFNKPKLPTTKEKATNLEKQISDLQKQITALTNEKTKIINDLTQKNISVANLEQQINNLKTEKPYNPLGVQE